MWLLSGSQYWGSFSIGHFIVNNQQRHSISLTKCILHSIWIKRTPTKSSIFCKSLPSRKSRKKIIFRGDIDDTFVFWYDFAFYTLFIHSLSCAQIKYVVNDINWQFTSFSFILIMETTEKHEFIYFSGSSCAVCLLLLLLLQFLLFKKETVLLLLLWLLLLLLLLLVI